MSAPPKEIFCVTNKIGVPFNFVTNLLRAEVLQQQLGESFLVERYVHESAVAAAVEAERERVIAAFLDPVWAKSRYGEFCSDSSFRELSPEDALTYRARWIGGTDAMQLLRAAAIRARK